MRQLKYMVETGVFGVCAYWGDKLGIAASRIRLFFVYATFWRRSALR